MQSGAAGSKRMVLQRMVHAALQGKRVAYATHNIGSAESRVRRILVDFGALDQLMPYQNDGKLMFFSGGCIHLTRKTDA